MGPAVGIWIDWNKSQVFDPATDFYPCTGLTTGGIRTCQITVPGNTVYPIGATVFARVRIFDQAHLPGGSLDAGDSVGLANNGEVEGYKWEFRPTAINLITLTARASHPGLLLWMAGILLLGGGLGLVVIARQRKHHH